MAWYESKSLWSSVTLLIVIVGTFAAVYTGRSQDLESVLPFIGTILGSGAAGYAIGKGTSKKGGNK